MADKVTFHAREDITVSFADVEGKAREIKVSSKGYATENPYEIELLSRLADTAGHPIEHGPARRAKE